MSRRVITYGLDSNMRRLVSEQVSVHRHCDQPLHEAPADVVGETDIAIIFVFSEVRPDVCQRLSCDAIISLGAGVDHIHQESCGAHGITVCNTPHYGSHTVAEHTFTLLLAYERHLRKIENQNLDFERSPYLSHQLAGKTFGAVGTGGIGKAAARIAKGFGMNVVGFDVNQDEELADDTGFTYMDSEDVFAKADYVGLYAPATPATENMVDEDVLDAMKDDGVLVNTARAHLVDHEALIKALDTAVIRGALLDVVDSDYRDRLASHQKTILTPHHAFYTEAALQSMAKQAHDAVEEIRAGSIPSTALQE